MGASCSTQGQVVEPAITRSPTEQPKIATTYHLLCKVLEGNAIPNAVIGTEPVSPLVEVWVNNKRGTHKFVEFEHTEEHSKCRSNQNEFVLENPLKSFIMLELWKPSEDYHQVSGGNVSIFLNKLKLKQNQSRELSVNIGKTILRVQLTALDFEVNGADERVNEGDIDAEFGVLSNKRRSTSSAQFNTVFESIFVEDLVKTANTGDILAYSGTAAASKTIQMGSHSMWSHVAVLVRDPSDEIRKLYKLGNTHHVFALESDVPTMDLREGGGVQLVELEHWYREAYLKNDSNSLMVVRRINRNKDYDWGSGSYYEPSLTQFLKRVYMKPYEMYKVEMIMALMDLNAPRASDRDSYFCSELVTDCLKSVNAVKNSVTMNNVIPKEVTADSDFLNGVAEEGVSWAKSMQRLILRASLDDECSFHKNLPHTTTLSMYSQRVYITDMLNIRYHSDYDMQSSWIGVYPAGASNEEYHCRAFTCDTRYGSASLKFNGAVLTGKWEIRFFGTKDSTRLLASLPFELVPSPNPNDILLSANCYQFVDEEYITVTYNAQRRENVGEKPWIGAYKKGTVNYTRDSAIWDHTDGMIGGSVTLKMNVGSEPGEWEICYFKEANSTKPTSKLGVQAITANTVVCLKDHKCANECSCNGIGIYTSELMFKCSVCASDCQSKDKAVHICPKQDVCVSCVKHQEESILLQHAKECSCDGDGKYELVFLACNRCKSDITVLERSLHVCPDIDLCKNCARKAI